MTQRMQKDEDLMAEGINRITVKGFKSLAEECSVEVRPLTILAGANSSGKSSIMQPLLMMKQTLEASYDPGALLLDGLNARFTSADRFLSRSQDKTGAKFSIALERNDVTSLNAVFVNDPQKGMEIAEIAYKEKKRRWRTPARYDARGDNCGFSQLVKDS